MRQKTVGDIRDRYDLSIFPPVNFPTHCVRGEVGRLIGKKFRETSFVLERPRPAEQAWAFGQTKRH